VFLSAFTMLAISIDRYRAVIFPLRPRLTTSKAAAVIGATWLLAAVASLPVAINARTKPVDGQNGDRRDFCEEVWPGGRDQRYAYSMAVMVLQYFMPLAILSFTYLNIGIVIWVKRAPGEAENTRDQRFAASKRKVLSACFDFCTIRLKACFHHGCAALRVAICSNSATSLHIVAQRSCSGNGSH